MCHVNGDCSLGMFSQEGLKREVLRGRSSHLLCGGFSHYSWPTVSAQPFLVSQQMLCWELVPDSGCAAPELPQFCHVFSTFLLMPTSRKLSEHKLSSQVCQVPHYEATAAMFRCNIGISDVINSLSGDTGTSLWTFNFFSPLDLFLYKFVEKCCARLSVKRCRNICASFPVSVV